jgi:DNA polymerase II small subunit/DNA polymerase delta subunit B
VNLVGCIIRKFVTMHDHMNVKFVQDLLLDEVTAVTGACTNLMKAVILLQSFRVIFNL